MMGAQCDTVFILKCLLKQAPFRYVGGCFLMGIGVCGWIFMVAESPLDRIHSRYVPHTFFNSCWASICTMTTVGYGDIFPRTIIGRLTGLCCAIYGTGIVSLMLVTFTTFFQMDSCQSRAFTVIKRLKIRDRIKENAGMLLLTINKKSDRDDIDLEFARYSEIKRLIGTFRQLRRLYKSTTDISLEDSMVRGFDNLAGHLTDLKDMVIDQNEWYEEMFYDGSSYGNPSDCYDINDTVPEESETGGHKKGIGAGARMRRAYQRKENLR
jgi:hypothetical protein